jgi:hypothetical protein
MSDGFEKKNIQLIRSAKFKAHLKGYQPKLGGWTGWQAISGAGRYRDAEWHSQGPNMRQRSTAPAILMSMKSNKYIPAAIISDLKPQ